MESLPTWLTSTLIPIPALLWVYIGLGLPWALVLLPRRDWTLRVMVLCLGFALGPTLLTAWMFVLGMAGALRLDIILVGLAVMTLAGTGLALRKRVTTSAQAVPLERAPLAFDEKLLVALMTVAVVLRWISIAFWPFTAYDALWVFGYEGRLYALLGEIPGSIGYYPQFMPLQYTFAQLVAGGVNDHAARAVIGFTHVGSILAAYVLGARLFTRRVGLIAAALWALYPHVGDWARFGDLEIPLTFLFTAAAAFFLHAWTTADGRRRYALIAGVLLGAAMWTKPTAGAFIWGVLLLLAIELVRVRYDWAAFRPRFEVALLTGLASIPLGAAWYIRNALLGHNIIDFPPAYWLTQAARSGAEFGWPLLALLVLLVFLHFGPVEKRPDARYTLVGLLLVLGGLLPSIIEPHRMGVIEWGLLGAGVVIVYRGLRKGLRGRVESPDPTSLSLRERNFLDRIPDLLSFALREKGPGDEGLRQQSRFVQHPLKPISTSKRQFAVIGWGLALALPYFVTWFYSYSYHPRLSFAIVPLMILPTAVIVGDWLTAERLATWGRNLRWMYGLVIVMMALPGVVATLYDGAAGWDWLWNGELADDFAKYESGNAALMWVVDGLQIFIDEHPDEPLVVAAPGVDRLPFFFPLADIRVDEAPTRLEQLEDVVYFVDSSPEGQGLYEHIPIQQNQVLGGLSLAGSTIDNIARRAWWKDDGFFNYTVYELHLDRRFDNPATIHDPQEPVIFGDFVRYRGHGIGADTFWPGRPVYLQLYWEVVGEADADYMVYVHLRDAEDELQFTWDGPVSHSDDGRYYSTLVWEPGEFIRDERLLKLSSDDLPPVGEGYRLVIGMYDLQTGARLPVTVGGEPAGDGYMLNERLRVIAEAP